MGILELPSEVMSEIMDYVGSAYFREDMSRLIVCKQWYLFARPTFLKEVQVTQKLLNALLSSETADKTLQCIKVNMEVLDLTVREAEDWRFPGEEVEVPEHFESADEELDWYLSAFGGDEPDPLFCDEETVNRYREVWVVVPNVALLRAWKSKLEVLLTQLGNVIEDTPRLRTLRLRAWPLLQSSHREFAFLPSGAMIRKLLTTQDLTVLELDIPVWPLNDDFHLCPVIGSLLSTLRRLHLRMAKICPDALKPQHESNALRLSEVVVNLSLFNNMPYRPLSHGWSSSCHGPTWLGSSMRHQAAVLATQMASPKIVRILSHNLLLDLGSSDILTGSQMSLGKCKPLGEGPAWDDDGKILRTDTWYPDIADGRVGCPN